MSDSLRSNGLLHASLPCPLPSPWVWADSLSFESLILTNHLILHHPFLLLPSIFPSIRVFSNEIALPIKRPNYGVLASASVLPMNIQGWFPLGLTLIFLHSKRLSRVFSSTTIGKHQFFSAQPSLWYKSYICTWLLENL